MKKKILGLLLFSLLPLSSLNFTNTTIHSPVEIKEAATKIDEKYYLSQNPTDNNRPADFTSQTIYKTLSVDCGSIQYMIEVNNIGYAYSAQSRINVRYQASDDFWIKDATYTIFLKGKQKFDGYNSRYISIISNNVSSSDTTIKFKMTDIPTTSLILFYVLPSKTTVTSVDEFNSFISTSNNYFGNGTSRLSTRTISYFKRDSGYTLNDGGETTVYINVDDNVSIENVISQVKAQDIFGFDVPVTYQANGYNPKVIGTYSIPISAKDSYGQTANATIKAVVKDYVAPVISTKEINFNCTEKIDFNDVKQELVVSDNYYKNASDITLESVSLSSGLEWNKDLACGEYQMTVRAKDPSNNQADYNIKVIINDNVAPIIKDLAGNIPTETIKVGVAVLNTDLSALVLSMFIVEDNSDPDLKVSISAGQIEKKVGVYEITLTSSDKAGNVVNQLVTFEVLADGLPVFLLNPLFAITTSDSPLDIKTITTLIADALPTGYSNLSINQDDVDLYLKNSHKPGENEIKFSYLDPSGEQQDSLIVVSIQGAVNNSLFTKITSSWQTLFTNISSMNLSNWIFVILSLVLIVSIICLAYYGLRYFKNRQLKKSACIEDSNEDETMFDQVNQVNMKNEVIDAEVEDYRKIDEQ